MTYLNIPHVLAQAPDDEATPAAAALWQLVQAGACCGPDNAAGPAAPHATAPTVNAAPRRRGRHTTRPRSRRFVLPQVTVIDPAAGPRDAADLPPAHRDTAPLPPPA